jgi:Flp pilus assembly protein TadD
MQKLSRIILLVLLAFVFGCSEEDSGSTDPSGYTTATTGDEQVTEITREMISEGRQLLVDKKYEQAISWATKLEANHPEQLEVQLIMAIAQFASGNIDAALKKTTMILAKHPDDPRVIANHALVLDASGKLDEAIENLESGIEKVSESEHLHAALAALYFKAGDSVKAEAHFIIVRSINPTYDGIPVGSGFEKFTEVVIDNAALILTLLIAIVEAVSRAVAAGAAGS